VDSGLAADFNAATPDTTGAAAAGVMDESISAPVVATPTVRLIMVNVLMAALLVIKGLLRSTMAFPPLG
jgi:hypothetical protein